MYSTLKDAFDVAWRCFVIFAIIALAVPFIFGAVFCAILSLGI